MADDATSTSTSMSEDGGGVPCASWMSLDEPTLLVVLKKTQPRDVFALTGTSRGLRNAIRTADVARELYAWFFGGMVEPTSSQQHFARTDEGAENGVNQGAQAETRVGAAEDDDGESCDELWKYFRARSVAEDMWRRGAHAKCVTLRGHTDWVHAAHARWKRHPTDDTYDVVVLSASDDGTLRTWDVKRAAMIKCAPSPTPEHLVPHHVKLSDVVAAEDAASNAANVDATRDQSRSSCVVEWGEPESCPLTLRVGGEKGRELHVHDASGVRITTLLGHTARIECCELNTASHLGKVRVACGGRDGMLNVWDIDGSAIEDGGGHHHEPMACFSHASTVRTLCLGNAGQSVVTGCSDGSLSHFDLANCDRIGHLNPPDVIASSEGVLSVHCVTSLACDVRHTRCVAGRRNGVVTIWSLEGRHAVLCTLSDHTAAILVTSLDPFSLVTASKDRTVCVYLYGGEAREENQEEEPEEEEEQHMAATTMTSSADESFAIADARVKKQA